MDTQYLEVKFNKISSSNLKNIIDKLILSMRSLNGAGLAANQIFYNLRICVIELENNTAICETKVKAIK